MKMGTGRVLNVSQLFALFYQVSYLSSQWEEQNQQKDLITACLNANQIVK